ncbi:hypothetical protein SOVF_048720 [Spinacia oleracea]|uniref:F-box domain-containing protein n=1 Tax=Spinacia oleracea TaxID=3562 RepID=A0ABM3RAE7_SPIOL|nr:uncharacterized protein LOC130467784 [Spinacia oleracea]KNA20829.1 hypothetical protein SOVF_048720 [Spinacia oleracea]
MDAVKITSLYQRARKIKSKEEEAQQVEDQDVVVYLPEEVIFNLLLRLPASVLNNVMRYICRTWYDIISSPDFRRAHFEHSTHKGTSPGFLFVQQNVRSSYVSFVQPISTSGAVKVSNISFPWGSSLDVWDSYDGLCLIYNGGLISNSRYRDNFHVFYPTTNQYKSYSHPPPYSGGDPYDLRLARSLSRKYKLIYQNKYEKIDNNSVAILHILDIGNDFTSSTWRILPLEIGGERSVLHYEIVNIGAGVVHVLMCNLEPLYYLVEIDLETQVVNKIPNPPCYRQGVRPFFPKGRHLTALHYHNTMNELNVWTLSKTTRHDSATWSWTMLCNINLENATSLRQPCDVEPLAWFKHGNLLIFGSLEERKYVVLDVKTAKTTSFSMSPAFRWPLPTLVPYESLFA